MPPPEPEAFFWDEEAERRFERWRREHLLLVEPAIERLLPADRPWPRHLQRAMRYAVGSGGKRMRPLLCLAAFEAAGGPRDQGFEAVLPPACAVELLHSYSLVHDDLPAMDNSAERRGQPAVHRAFGEALGILTGDALLTDAFRVVLDEAGYAGYGGAERRATLALWLAEAAGSGGMVGGQSFDMGLEGPVGDERALTFLHRRKTGDLFRFAVEAGAFCAGVAPAELGPWRRFAEAFGLAFQVRDDVLDAAQDTTRGGRSEAETPSFVHVLGVEGAAARARELLDHALDAIAPLGDEAFALRALAWLSAMRDR